ncbi:MAG: outer membrane beta-barrel protein [Ignavibacteriaceae bacterium]
MESHAVIYIKIKVYILQRYTIVSLLIIILSSTICSQTIQDYGVKIGYVSSRESYTSQPIYNRKIRSKSGYSVSIFLDLFNLKGISVSPEVKYIQKGVEMVIPIGSADPTPRPDKIVDIYHNYLSIPISFSYRIPLSFGIPFLRLAPRYDILLSSYEDYNDANLPNSIYQGFKNDFGGSFSLGFIPKFDIGFSPFIELSYHMDFTSTYSSPSNSIKNNTFEVDLGVLFQ